MTGGIEPSCSEKSEGSTVISPSCRFQYVHIGRSRTTSPPGVCTSIVDGMPSIAQRPFAHGPGATTTCSAAMRPSLVSTASTVPSAREAKPVTSTGARMRTPSASHLPTRPLTESVLNAKPPWCSCSRMLTPRARQSGNMAFM